ncbi:MAG: hypothetical protein AAGG44_01155 [Planctomycetota bacterium]
MSSLPSKSRRHDGQDFAVGQDSFLDTTANLVGILIILVVVVGTKTKAEAIAHSQKSVQTETPAAIEEAQQQTSALQASLKKQQAQLVSYQREKIYRKAERDQLLQRVAVARETNQALLTELTEEQQELVEKQSKMESLQSEIAATAQQIGAKEAAAERPTIVLEHLPTPMARTVFTKELHIQIKDGRVTLIPWDRLVAMLKQQVPLAVRRKSSRRVIDDTLGPIGGFLMRYRLQAVPGGFELDRFELSPTDGVVSESVQESLATAGRLNLELATRDPSETVVTAWVYPDSFEAFREVKATMFQRGFLSAARPLPEGVLIGASPRGTRSSAQ